MISIILITFIILMIMSRGVNIDLDINVTENFDPINMEEEVEVIEDPWINYIPSNWIKKEEDFYINPEFLLLINREVYGETDDEDEEEDYYPEYFKSKKLLSLDEIYYKDLKRRSKRGDHGHKGYTRTQTLAYKKAREFKTSHLNEWC